MKTILWCSTVFAVDDDEREQRRPIGRDKHAYRELLESLERHAIWADELGYDAFGGTEHHFQSEGGESIPNNLLLYAKLAAKTQRIVFIPMSVVLTARDPIRTAEDLALFSHMYPGRIAVCFARGYQTRWMQTLMQQEAISAGRPGESDTRNRAIFDEHLQVVERAWAEDSLAFRGEHYQVPFPSTGVPNWPAAPWTRRFGAPGDADEQGTVHKVGVIPKPTSSIPIFVPNTMSQQTVIDAARAGRTVLKEISDRDAFGQAAALYHDQALTAGRDIRLGEGFGAVAKIALGDSFDEAMDLAARTVGNWFRKFFQYFGINEGLRTPADPPGPIRFPSDLALAERMYEKGALLCGTPSAVLEQLHEVKRCYADGDLEWFGWEFWAQCLPDPDAIATQRRQMELFAREIQPHLR
jgi:alkanesulfonate monooxygenase SsuD/methylene tetrahydromethanopterin reductase-like flavin-dependent oxidoreductase (luciferase family)